MKFAVTLAVMVALFGVCSARIVQAVEAEAVEYIYSTPNVIPLIAKSVETPSTFSANNFALICYSAVQDLSSMEGPGDIERYGHGIFRQLCNYDVTQQLVLNQEEFFGTALPTNEGPIREEFGKNLEISLRKKNRGLDVVSEDPKVMSTGMNDKDFALMYKLLFEQVNGLTRQQFTAEKAIKDAEEAAQKAADKAANAPTDKEAEKEATAAAAEAKNKAKIADTNVTVDEFILYLSEVNISKELLDVKKEHGRNATITKRTLPCLLARFIAAIADDTGDSHMDASEFTGAVLGDGALPYTASVVMFRFMDFEKDNGGRFDTDSHTLVHTSVLVRWLLGGTTTFAEGVEQAFFMPITA